MSEIFYLGSIFCALLSVYLLLFKQNAMRSYADYILSAYFLLQVWCVSIYLLIFSSWIIYLPHLYKTAAPINFLIPPLSYLYVRAVLFNEKKMTKLDLLHFIPFVFFFINYLPFFILPVDQKIKIVDATTKNMSLAYKYNAGLLPEFISYLLRPLQIAIYLILQWRLIIQFKKEYHSKNIQKQIQDVLKWLKVYNWSSTIFLFSFIALVIFGSITKNIFTSSLTSLLPGILISLSFFIMSVYLLIHPEVLNGLPFIKYKEIESLLINNESTKIPFIIEDYHAEIESIDDYFNTKQPYLINSLTIGQVALVLNIPVRELSYIINNHYAMRFTDYLNSYRIQHVIKNFNKSDLDIYTIESLAKQSGFSSKSSFYRAFQKMHQCTPLEYLQNNTVQEFRQ